MMTGLPSRQNDAAKRLAVLRCINTSSHNGGGYGKTSAEIAGLVGLEPRETFSAIRWLVSRKLLTFGYFDQKRRASTYITATPAEHVIALFDEAGV